MVEFNKLIWSPITQTLTIDTIVSSLSYYTNVYIDKIVIDTQDTYKGIGPSSTPVFSYQFDSTTNSKTYQKVLSKSDMTLSSSSNIFFVYVITKGTPSSTTPCGMDNATSLGVTFDMSQIYGTTLSYLKELNGDYDIPKNFIDIILKYRALQVCINTKNYDTAILYWNSFFRTLSYPSTTLIGCCNG